MTELQRIIKYFSIAFAIFLTVSIITGVIGVLGGIFFMESNDVLDEMRDIELSQDIDRIEIEIDIAEFIIKTGESFALSTNLEKLNVKSEGGKLFIEEKRKPIHSTDVGEIILTVPAGVSFSSISLEAGAGKVSIESLSASIVDFDFGAGSIEIDKLSVTNRADIDTGAGKFVIRDGEINDLDLDLGVGENKIRSSLTGECDIDCGVGKTELTVLGSKNDYSIRIDKGVGSASIDGSSVGNDLMLGNGANKLNIDGGVGSIDVRFEQ